MIYKERKAVLARFFACLLVYGIAAQIALNRTSGTFFLPGPARFFSYSNTSTSYFEQWSLTSLLATTIIGIAVSMDSISHETSKGTIGFLLTRPLSRMRVYTTKVGLNLAGLAAAYLTAAVCVWLWDQSPRSISVFQVYELPTPPGQCSLSYRTDLVGERMTTGPGLGQFLGIALLVLLTGAAVICLGMLISTFARTYLQSLIICIITVALLVCLFLLLNGRSSNNALYSVSTFIEHSLLNSLYLAVVAGGLFWIGLTFFRHKEF